MGLLDVSNILWRERELLELLLFKLEEEQLLLAAGKNRWLASAAREVEAVLEHIKAAELARSAQVEAYAAELRLPHTPSLRELAASAPPPWGAILADHRDAFLAATHEIVAVAQTNRDLLTSGQEAVSEALRWLTGPSDDLYHPRGTPAHASSGPVLVDEAL